MDRVFPARLLFDRHASARGPVSLLDVNGFLAALAELQVPQDKLVRYCQIFSFNESEDKEIDFAHFVSVLSLLDSSVVATMDDFRRQRLDALFYFFDLDNDSVWNATEIESVVAHLIEFVTGGSLSQLQVSEALSVLSGCMMLSYEEYWRFVLEGARLVELLLPILMIPALSLPSFGLAPRLPFDFTLLEHPLLQSAGFKRKECNLIIERYHQICTNPGFMTVPEFEEFMIKTTHAPPDYCNAYFVAFNISGSGTLTCEELVLGLAAMDWSNSNSDERLRYIFRMYADRATKTIKFSGFNHMIRHIRRSQGRDVDANSVHEAAATVFVSSGLDINTGSISEDMFVGACLQEASLTGFPGTSGLFRLPESPVKDVRKRKSGIIPQSLDTSLADVHLQDTFVSNGLSRKMSAPHPDSVWNKINVPGPQLSVNASSSDSSHSDHTLFVERPVIDPSFEPCLTFLETILSPDFEVPAENTPFTVLNALDIKSLTVLAREKLAKDAMCVQVQGPARLFGDIHGQLRELLRIFQSYGIPHHRLGDVHLVNYVFIGDFVDRGPQSLEVILLLLAIKVRYPDHVFLIRGNHEDREINAAFGFQEECLSRLGEKTGAIIWELINVCFDWMPVAAVIENKIFCVHGGVGANLSSLDEIQAIPRPCPSPTKCPQSELLKDLLWSDPTDFDHQLGVYANEERGPQMIKFGPDRVHSFLQNNGLQLIVRAHQCVQAGYEFFATERLITVFSAANYTGRYHNAGACLDVSRDLCVWFRVIEPSLYTIPSSPT